MGAFDIASIGTSGATDAAVYALVLDPSLTFDDLTPMTPPLPPILVPAANPWGLLVLAVLLLSSGLYASRVRNLYK